MCFARLCFKAFKKANSGSRIPDWIWLKKGGKGPLIIEDLRNVFTSCRDELIEVSGDFIYYAEEKMEEGHNILFLLEYNRKTKRERIITNYI